MTCEYVDETDGRNRRCRNLSSGIYRFCQEHRQLIRLGEDPNSMALRVKAQEIAAAHGSGADWEER